MTAKSPTMVKKQGDTLHRVMLIGFGGLVMLSLSLRLWLGRGLPLWLDESWTGMIASQGSWHAFWREAWLDVNPPLYYVLMAGWTQIAGLSDLALRAPSMVFGLSAALLPLFWRVPGLPRWAIMAWAALLLAWQPGLALSLDARGYALLLFLSVAQSLAFIRLMAMPHRRAAWLWAGLASLAGLTHYFALLVAGLQGLAFLWVQRDRALACWPASLAFVPAFGWLAIHAPRLADYARPDIAWYPPMTGALATDLVRYAYGAPGWVHMALVLVTLVLTIALSRGASRACAAQPGKDVAAQAAAIRWAAITAILGLCITLGLGTLRPMVTDRYLVPLVPTLLLGLIAASCRWRHGWLGAAALVIIYWGSMDLQAQRALLVAKTRYSFAPASAFVADARPARLVFTWDHPAAGVLDPGSVAKLGGFFLQRNGQIVDPVPVRLQVGEDGNAILKAWAKNGAVIWIYNRARRSAARDMPPDPQRWSDRRCIHQHTRWIGIFACQPPAR